MPKQILPFIGVLVLSSLIITSSCRQSRQNGSELTQEEQDSLLKQTAATVNEKLDTANYYYDMAIANPDSMKIRAFKIKVSGQVRRLHDEISTLVSFPATKASGIRISSEEYDSWAKQFNTDKIGVKNEQVDLLH